MICRAVVTYLNERTLWGRLVYAPDGDGESVVDALSAALMVNAAKVARGIRLDGVAKRKQFARGRHQAIELHRRRRRVASGDAHTTIQNNSNILNTGSANYTSGSHSYYCRGGVGWIEYSHT